MATSSAKGMMSASDKAKLDGIAAKANNYAHPANHPASMITQDSTHRFVTDTEKSNWNGKAAGNHSHSYLQLSGGTLSGILNASKGISIPTGFSVEFKTGSEYTAYCDGYIASSREFQIRSVGNPGILTDGGLYILKRSTTGYSPIYASAFSVQSTKASKENFSAITNEEALNLLKILSLHFDYINGEKNQSGFIAEDVEKFYPEICSYQKDNATGERKLFGIDYSKFTPYIVKLLQMQEERITQLENVIKGESSAAV